VRETMAAKKTLTDLDIEDFRKHSPRFERDVLELLDPENSLKVRSVIGGPSPGLVRERIRKLCG
jgi:argininosuccinate lyase